MILPQRKKDKGAILSFSASFRIKYSNGGCSGFEPDFLHFTQPTTFQNRKFVYYYIIDPEKIKGVTKKCMCQVGVGKFLPYDTYGYLHCNFSDFTQRFERRYLF